MKTLTKGIAIVCFLISFSCQDEENHFLGLTPLQERSLKTVLELGQDKNFREFILNTAIEQRNGEYAVLFTEMIDYCEHDQELKKYAHLLGNLRTQMMQIQNFEPHVFYPRAETIEDMLIESRGGRTKQIMNVAPPVGVVDDGTNSPNGYTVNYNGSLVYYAQISEEYAWENDVWAVGYQEMLDPENMVSAPEPQEILESRSNNEAEYGGMVKVLDLGAIESWVSGKLEFRFIVTSPTGVILNDLKPGKIKRKYFRDQKIYDMNKFLFNWNTSVIGTYVIESWVEQDGGGSEATITQSFPAACQGCPTTTVTYTIKNKDDDLGRTIMQFADSKSQWYSVSFMNVKHN